MTALDSIYTALYGWNTTWSTDVQVHVWNYTDLDTSKKPACPQRYLSPMLEADSAFVLLGNTMSAEWSIEDTLLIKPAGEGNPLKENAANIVKAINAYVEIVRANRAPTAQSHIKEFSISPGVYYWPDSPEGGIGYVGVRFTLQIQEVIT